MLAGCPDYTQLGEDWIVVVRDGEFSPPPPPPPVHRYPSKIGLLLGRPFPDPSANPPIQTPRKVELALKDSIRWSDVEGRERGDGRRRRERRPLGRSITIARTLLVRKQSNGRPRSSSPLLVSLGSAHFLLFSRLLLMMSLVLERERERERKGDIYELKGIPASSVCNSPLS